MGMPFEYLAFIVIQRHNISVRQSSSISIIGIGSEMSEANQIAAYKVARAPDGLEVAFEDLWKDSRCVIVFLRRFG